MAATTKPLSQGKSYHFHVIYNHAILTHLATDEQKLSLKFVEFLVDKLSSGGYTKYYYHEEHSIPGRDVFRELCRVIKESEWTVVVVTKEFSANGWVQYCRNTTLKKLIDERKEDSLIPIALGIDSIPEDMGAKEWLYFSADPETWSEGTVDKIRKVLDEGLPNNRAESDHPKEDHGDGRLRTDGGQLVGNPQPSLPATSNTVQNWSEKGSLVYLFATLCLSKTQPISSSAVVDRAKNTSNQTKKGGAGEDRKSK
ncbi:hypothetical protein ACJMK2_004147 [Sinanodonta woodiana]|uniref:TIR domain-containing protein n=1 Tax=Sinanodonta woodiana TaxID=1069815 RepID=A0ABD3Y0A9_SINWO